MDNLTRSAVDVAWFAGLFEGEGSIEIAKNGGVRLCIRMTDLDVIERVDRMFPGSNSIQAVVPKPVRPGFNQPKTQYAWRTGGEEPVTEVLTAILPYLGERRSERAREALRHFETRRSAVVKTHCKNGHELTPENLRNGRKGGCRTCYNDWSKDYQRKRAAAKRISARLNDRAEIVSIA